MKKIISYIFSLSILLVALNSCEVDRTESVFEDLPSVRIENEISELRTLLLAQSQGFSGVYFPNNSVVGGINFHMNFTPDLRVKITSDFKNDTSLTDTRYEIVTGTTAAELVFTTGSRHITDLVQDGAAGFNTFFGSNSFQYAGEENGVITFKDVRSDGIFELFPSGFSDFDTESVASANTTYSSRLAFTEVDCTTASVFDNLVMEVNNGGEVTNYILNYNADNIFFDAETTDAQGISARQGFGVAFTLIGGEQALSISPSLEVGEQSFKNFILDLNAPRTQYVATVNGVTATISNVTLASPSGAELNNDITLLESAFLYRPALGSNALTSSCFNTLVLDQISANLDAAFGAGAFTFTEFQFIFNFNSDACDNFLFTQITRTADGATFNAFYCFNRASVSNNRLFQEYTGPFGTGNGPLLEGVYAPLIDFFNNPAGTSSGMLYTNEDTFRSNTSSFPNISGTFTKMDNQALRVYGLFFG